MRVRSAVVLMALLALTGCGTASSRTGAVPTPVVSADPMGLVGMWQVRVDGTPVGVLRLGGEAAFFGDCGAYEGQWFATHDGGFLAQPQRAQGCHEIPTWLDLAQGYRVDGADRLLVDTAGKQLARLSRGGHPVVPAGLNATYYGSTPTPVPGQAERSAEPAALPEGVRPVTERDLQAHLWRSPTAPRAFLTFAPDGSWRGSNGCTVVGGRYSVGGRGELLAVGLPVDAVACNPMSGAGVWLVQGGRLGIVDGQLAFFAKDGHERGRYLPEPLPTASPS